MSLKWSSQLSQAPQGGSKTKNGRFSCEIALHLTKFCYKLYMCENCQRQRCKAVTGLTISAKWWGTSPSVWKFGAYRPTLSRRRFLIYFRWWRLSRNTWRKSSINTNIRRPLRAFQWAQDEHRTFSLSSPNAVSKIWTISCDNSETVRDRMAVTINH